MTFPVQEEDSPAPPDDSEPQEASKSADTPTVEESESSTEPAQEKKSFQWKPVHFAGLGLFVALASTVLFCARRAPNPAPPTVEAIPTPQATVQPSASTTPVLAAGIPESPAPTQGLDAIPLEPHQANPPGNFTATPEASSAPKPESGDGVKEKKPQAASQNPASGSADSTDASAVTKKSNQEKSSSDKADNPVTMEMPSDEAATASSATPTEAPAQVPANGPKDLLESSEPNASPSPTAAP